MSAWAMSATLGGLGALVAGSAEAHRTASGARTSESYEPDCGVSSPQSGERDWRDARRGEIETRARAERERETRETRDTDRDGVCVAVCERPGGVMT